MVRFFKRFPIFASCIWVAVGAEWKVGQPVQTTSGLVQGRPAALAGHEQVSEYLGIPFAAPPVGKLRWKPPQKFNGTGKTIDATKWGSSCPTGPGGADITGSRTEDMDEDCLSINVWTKPQNGSKTKAVLFNLYGGGFNVGKSSTPYLNGAPLADREDIIVVSINYRLNVLGFPGAPGLTDQNFGMLDVRAAMEWTRDNIGAFGGDPTKITLFGESAGAGGADYYAFAWPEDPIANGFILQSGSVFTRGIAAKSNEQAWYKLTKEVGCGGEESGVKTVECMKGKEWKTILNHVDTGVRVPGKTFGPVFDEKVIFEDYASRAKAGRFAKRPVLVGSNHNEAGLFRTMKNLTSEQVHRLNLCFTCVAAYSANARTSHNVTTFRYRYFGDWDNVKIVDGSGAFHGSELALVFGTPKRLESRIASTKAEEAVEKLLMSSWAGFANDPENYLKSIGWPAYVGPKSLIRIAYQNNPQVSFAGSTEYDGDCASTYEPSGDSIDRIMGKAP